MERGLLVGRTAPCQHFGLGPGTALGRSALIRLRPSLAGRWYQADAGALNATVDRMLAAVSVPERPQQSTRGLIVPHAGHRYSGPVAAHAYRAITGHPHPNVVVLGPLHAGHRQPLLTSAFDAYQTPLGRVPVDRAALVRVGRALEPQNGHGLAAIDETWEHSIEVQLPFLQVVLREFALVPIMLADQTAPVARALATALHIAFDGELPLLVASSDLSHYYPQTQAERLDRELLRRIVALDPDGVLQAAQEGTGRACGSGAIATTLWALAEGGGQHLNARVLRYATSGDVTGEVDSVVGYAAVALYWSTEAVH